MLAVTSLFEDPQALGKAIRKARRVAGLSQEGLGEATGTSKSTVVRWESAQEGAKPRTPQARRSIAAAVAEATGVPRSDLGLGEPARDEFAAEITQQIQELRAQLEDLLADPAIALEDAPEIDPDFERDPLTIDEQARPGSEQRSAEGS